jgi:hypothetical protein
MADRITGRPDHINDVLVALHAGHVGGQKWSWTPNQPHVYANIIEQPGYEGTLPTEQELNDQLAAMQAEFDGNDYRRKRKAVYLSIEDQFDMLFHSMEQGDFEFTEWRNAIRAVKEEFPKGK